MGKQAFPSSAEFGTCIQISWMDSLPIKPSVHMLMVDKGNLILAKLEGTFIKGDRPPAPLAFGEKHHHNAVWSGHYGRQVECFALKCHGWRTCSHTPKGACVGKQAFPSSAEFGTCMQISWIHLSCNPRTMAHFCICDHGLQLTTLYPGTHVIAVWEGMNIAAKQGLGRLFRTTPTLRGVTIVQASNRFPPAQVCVFVYVGVLAWMRTLDLGLPCILEWLCTLLSKCVMYCFGSCAGCAREANGSNGVW